MAKTKAKGGATASSKRRRTKQVDKWKAKSWYEVNASPEFDEIYIGQTPAASDERVLGRIIETSLYDFTKDFNHSHIKLRFKIVEVNGTLCKTMLVGHEMTRDYVKSLIRRGANRIDGLIDVTTKDGFKFRITGAVITKGMSKSSQQRTIRKIMFDIIEEKAKTLNCKEFTQEIVFSTIERDIRRISNEIYPIRDCKLIKSRLLTKLL